MELRINISKVHLFVFIGVIVLFGAVMFVIAQSPKNPGHPALQIESGTLSGDFSFNEPITITPTRDDTANFLTVENTDKIQNHIAIISNKNDFGVWSNSLDYWSNTKANVVYARNVNTNVVYTTNINDVPVTDFCKKDGSGCKPLDGNNCRWVPFSFKNQDIICASDEYMAGITQTPGNFGLYVNRIRCCKYIP